ncbi:methylated-DNA--[protein]-cysteine S-methyltransferase [Chloroflexi bacterium TSY]|nr:methylated-DNA--[protein]-cysteine S-methyltransferase [Chloroflexi bacterium TSY]
MSPNFDSTSDYARIEEAIRYLEENFREQPTLSELSAHLGFSPFYLQRLFTRWAGISPKRFVQFLTADYAKELLRNSVSVLDATYESGLSSPSRLHDLLINVEAVSPGEYKSSGKDIEIRYGFHDTPFGICLLGVTDRGICTLSFLSSQENGAGKTTALQMLKTDWSSATLIEKPEETMPLVEQIFPQNVKNLDESSSQEDANKTVSIKQQLNPSQRQVNLLLRGTNFQIKVWEALLKIPVGGLWSYSDVAREIGNPKAVRAVGSAVGVNPVAYLIPCHRVIRKSGAIRDYRWGALRKKALVVWEVAQVA